MKTNVLYRYVVRDHIFDWFFHGKAAYLIISDCSLIFLFLFFLGGGVVGGVGFVYFDGYDALMHESMLLPNQSASMSFNKTLYPRCLLLTQVYKWGPGRMWTLVY